MPEHRPAKVAVLPDVEPWKRLQGETSLAYQHFIRYREQEPWLRSVVRVMREVGRKSPEQLYTWSAQWRWRERAKAWDAYCEEEGRKAQLAKIRKAAETRVDVVLSGLTVIHDRLVGRDGIVDPETGEVLSDPVAAIDPNRLDAKDLAALGNVLTKMQTMAEEAAGVKEQKPQEIDIKLGFDLHNGTVVGQGRMVIEKQAERKELEQPLGELDAGEAEESD